MKNKIMFIFGGAVGLVLSLPALAQHSDVVYEDDGRRELIETPVNPMVTAAAPAIAALMPLANLTPVGANFRLPATTFGASYNLCPNERFADQPNPAFCTGFLVEPQVMATAASCISTPADCAQTAIVFDFAKTASGVSLDVPGTSVFHCQEIMQRVQGGPGNPDFVLIHLDTPTSNRTPLKIRRQGQIATGASVVAVGFPSGLPAKVMDGAKVMTSDAANSFFATDVDAFAGAAGSPVMATSDGVVEGILARGGKDYEVRGGCTAMKHCAAGECAGQEATRAGLLAEFIEDPSRPTRTNEHEYAALNLAIPDSNPTGITYEMPIDQPLAVAHAKILVRITHTYIADLKVTLIHPDGTEYILHNQAGGGTDNIDQEYDLLRTWREKPASGTWKLKVQDLAAQDVGTLTYVKLTLTTFDN